MNKKKTVIILSSILHILVFIVISILTSLIDNFSKNGQSIVSIIDNTIFILYHFGLKIIVFYYLFTITVEIILLQKLKVYNTPQF